SGKPLAKCDKQKGSHDRENREDRLRPKLIGFAEPEIKPQLGERNGQRVFRMTEGAAAVAKISSGKNAAVGKGVASFDFPIEQPVPTKGMNKRQIEDDRNFNENNYTEKNFEGLRNAPSRAGALIAAPFPASRLLPVPSRILSRPAAKQDG